MAKSLYNLGLATIFLATLIVGGLFVSVAHAQNAGFSVTCSEDVCFFSADDQQQDSYHWEIEGTQETHWELNTDSSTGNPYTLNDPEIGVTFLDCNGAIDDSQSTYAITLNVSEGGNTDSNTNQAEPTNCGGSEGGVDAVISQVAELPSCSNELSIDGSNSSGGGASEITCKWDWGNDGTIDRTKTAQASNNFQNCAADYVVPAPEASKEVALTVEANGNSDTDTRTFTGDNFPAVEAAFSWSKINNQELEFDANDSCSPWGNIQSYNWDWNADGTTDENALVAVITKDISQIPASGNQTATALLAAEMGDTINVGLKVTDSNGHLSDANVKTINTSSSGGGADASFTCNVDAEGEASCDAGMNDSAYSYTWDFLADPTGTCGIDGSTKTGQSVSHSFSSDAGTVKVCLEVRNKNNTSDSDTNSKQYTIGGGGGIEGNAPSAQGGLVPCSGVAGEDGAEKCTFQDLIILVENVIDFLITIATVIAMLMFAYAGFLYLTAGGNKNRVRKAHSIFRKVIFGIATMLLAWLIVNTILAALEVPEAYDLLG